MVLISSFLHKKWAVEPAYSVFRSAFLPTVGSAGEMAGHSLQNHTLITGGCSSTDVALTQPSHSFLFWSEHLLQKVPSGQLGIYSDLWRFHEILRPGQGLLRGGDAKVRALLPCVQGLNGETQVIF